jgi:hypothetical protein
MTYFVYLICLLLFREDFRAADGVTAFFHLLRLLYSALPPLPDAFFAALFQPVDAVSRPPMSFLFFSAPPTALVATSFVLFFFSVLVFSVPFSSSVTSSCLSSSFPASP